MAPRQAVFPANAARHAFYEAHGYSPSVCSGDLLFVSGNVGSREDARPRTSIPAKSNVPPGTSAPCGRRPAAASTTSST